MLAIQTQTENRFVPLPEIASLTPVYPNRTRVVLADGTVGQRPGPVPPGPWVRLAESWVIPQNLTRDGDHWKDPADYLYPFQALPDVELGEEETDLPEGLLGWERHKREFFWRTDAGLVECDLNAKQALQIYPQLCQVRQDRLVNLQRVRRFGPLRQKGWIGLDTGERVVFGRPFYWSVAQALGCESLEQIHLDSPPVLNQLRDFPYDLTTHDPDRIRRDCPTPEAFIYGLLWQTVLQWERGQNNDYGRDIASYFEHPLAAAARRCGYSLIRRDLSLAFSKLVHDRGVIQFHQLFFREPDPSQRKVGLVRPQVLLVAPWKRASEARPAADEHGISLLLWKFEENRMALESLASQLEVDLQLLFWQLDASHQKTVQKVLGQLERSSLEEPVLLSSLSELAPTLAKLPAPVAAPEPEPFRRIPLQAQLGQLWMADPSEIAAWSPTHFERWRVTLADGQVLHHPGPVPPGPWVSAEGHWVQPELLKDGKDPAGFPVPHPPTALRRLGAPCPPEQVLWLEATASGCCWHLQSGERVESEARAEQAAALHPSLIRFTNTVWINHNRIRSTEVSHLQLDDQSSFKLAYTRFTQKLKQVLGVSDFGQLATDDHGLLLMGLRDFPFEIARAPGAVLRSHFPTPPLLIYNICYQSFDFYSRTGQVPYGNTFISYFYRPLQATLYRAGFLTRAMLWGPISPKNRLYLLFNNCLHAMVYQHRLFTYRQFGFKDAYPDDRAFGEKRATQVLLLEKGDQVETIGRQLQQEFGLTLLVMRGNPALLASEYFAEELKRRSILEVEVYFYGDFDEAGWDIGPAFIRQLRFYGVACRRLARLVVPECFTAEELPVVSRAIDTSRPGVATRVQRWIREGGGIAGEARGIHANWLYPLERVRSRLEQLLA